MKSGLKAIATSLSLLSLSGCVFFHSSSQEQPAETKTVKEKPVPSAYLTKETKPVEPVSLGVMTLNAAETFALGSAVLSAAGKSGIDEKLVGIDPAKVASVSIVGHTDATGSEQSNMDLSVRRAQAVKEYLVSKGIADSKITATGKGESIPFASNDTADGRAQNRRVEVMFEVN